MQTRSNRCCPHSDLPRRFGVRPLIIALLVGGFLGTCTGCNEDTVQRDISQGAYQLFQNGLNSAITGLSSQITSSIKGASGSTSGP